MASPPGLFNAFRAEGGEHRLVAGHAQELDEVGARKAGGAGVDQRGEVEPLVPHHLGVEDDRDPASVSLIAPNGVTAPGFTPQTASRSSAEPNETRPCAPMRSWTRLRSTGVSSPSTSRNNRLFLSFTNRFLTCPPGMSPRSACDSSTVCRGGCSQVESATPR